MPRPWHTRTTTTTTLAALVALVWAGCSGAVVEPGQSTGAGGSGSGGAGAGGRGTGTPGGGGAGGADSTPVPVSALTLHRLNRVEYNNTVRDLVGTTLRPADDFIEDELGGKPGASFDNLADVLGVKPSVTRLSQYLTASKALVADLFARPELRQRVVVCDPAQGAACVGTILTGFAARAWRRPVLDTEITRLQKIVSDAIANGRDATTALRQGLIAVLTSPYFLYRVEVGAHADGSPRLLDGFELASRISYFAWSTMPDDALFADAAAHRLDTAAGVVTAVDRALQDPRAYELVSNFAGQWLYTRNLPDAQVSPAIVTGLNFPLLADSMRRETELFFRDFLYGDQSMSGLLTANFSYIDANLASFYKLAGAAPLYPTRTTLSAPERRGVLTQASILTVTSHSDQTSPVKRGKWILYNLLCTDIELPANFVPPALPPRQPGGTLRTQFEMHSKSPACAVCHQVMDPLGYALENYDPVGRYRTVDENNSPIDGSGTWNGGQKFAGAVQMEQLIASDARFAPCIVSNLYSYIVGRSPGDADQPFIAAIAADTSKSGFTMKQVIHAIVSSDPFRMQYAPAGGPGVKP